MRSAKRDLEFSQNYVVECPADNWCSLSSFQNSFYFLDTFFSKQVTQIIHYYCNHVLQLESDDDINDKQLNYNKNYVFTLVFNAETWFHMNYEVLK